jgi:phage-related protein
MNHQIQQIEFAGKSSNLFNIVVNGLPNIPRPERKMEVVAIPGRNGDLIFQQNAWSNYEQTYEIYIDARWQRDVYKIAYAVSQWLFQDGYQILKDIYNPDTYRYAYFKGPIDLENLLNTFGHATITFVCKPQRYLYSGNLRQVFTSAGRIHNPTVFNALPEITVHGSGSGALIINGCTVTMTDTNEVILDCENQNAYRDESNMNNTVSADEFPVLSKYWNSFSWSGGITGIDIIPHWWVL